jgi:hypothetical protein
LEKIDTFSKRFLLTAVWKNRLKYAQPFSKLQYNVIAKPRGGRRLGGGANRHRFSVVMLYNTPRCGEMTRDDDGQWGKYVRLVESSHMQPFYTPTMEEASSSVVGGSRGTRGLRRRFPAVEVYGRNNNRFKISYSYTGGRARGSDQRGRVVVAN